MTEQHDDHTWLNVCGEDWAIKRIERVREGIILHLWRGYAPHLKHCVVHCVNPDWDGYCKEAVRLLQQYFHRSD